jgi:hypothetical protein
VPFRFRGMMAAFRPTQTGKRAMFTRSTFAKIARAPEAVLTMSFAGILFAYVAAASAFA